MNEKTIWNYLYQKTGNAYGTAAIMGNLMAESSLNPHNATGKNKTQNYVSDADTGKVDFIHDGVAFGIVQWCYYSRKQGLIEMARKQNKSVGDLSLQLEYLWKELQGYKSVLNAVINAVNIRAASDIVMLKYEKPATTTEAAKQKRANYGQKFYDQFAEKSQPAPQPSGKKRVRATVDVNLRTGAGMDNTRIGKMLKGGTAELLATENGWHKVAVWVSGDFSEIID